MFDLDIIDKIDKYEVNNLEECLALCAKLREKDNLPHRIFIKESSYSKSFEFPYSNFFIEGAIEISNSLYGNKLDDEGVKLTTWRTATLKIKRSIMMRARCISPVESVAPKRFSILARLLY